MFTKLVRTSVPSNFFIIPVVFITGWWSLFTGHFPVFTNTRSILLELFPQIFSSYLWSTVISIVFIIFTSIIMVPFSSRYLHNTSGNSLPSFLFVIFISSYYYTFNSGPVIVSLFFCMLVLRYIFEIYHRERVYHFGFMAGFYSAIAALIYLPAITFVIVSWMGFILLRTFKMREFIVIAVGFIIPLILTHAIFMITGDEKIFYDLVENACTKVKPLFQNLRQIVLISIAGILVIWSVLKAFSSGSLKKVVLRRYFQIFTVAIAFFILAFFLFFSDFGLLAVVFLPLSFIMAVSLTSVRKQKFITMILFILIILQVISQVHFVLYSGS